MKDSGDMVLRSCFSPARFVVEWGGDSSRQTDRSLKDCWAGRKSNMVSDIVCIPFSDMVRI